MKMKNLLPLLFLNVILAGLWLSCESATGSKEKTPKEDATANAIQLSIDTFSTFPPEIDGCSCYFSADSTDFENRQYIYMNDYGKISFLKINGQLVKFTQTETKQIDEQTTFSQFKAKDYEMTIEVKELRQNGDETWLKTGTIKVIAKNGEQREKQFYGECGC